MTKSITKNIRVTDEDGVYRIKMVGQADVDFVNAFSKTAQELEKKAKKVTLVVDMEDVDYIDSSTLTIFIRLIKNYKKRNKNIFIYKPQANIIGLFKCTNLSRLLTICKTDNELENILAAKVKKRKKRVRRKSRS